MSVFGWIKRVLFPEKHARRTPKAAAHAEEPSPAAALPKRAPKPDDAPRAPVSMGGVATGLDREENISILLESPEEDLLWRLSQRIGSGELDVPVIPPGSMLALETANRPSVEVAQLVEVLSHDPLLTSELLRIANSALYATHNPAQSVHEAVMRIGLKSVRSVIFSAAMRASLSNARRLNEYAEEVWRQAQSVAHVARVLGRSVGFDAEQAYLIGLLHDIGKIALLGMLQTEMRDKSSLSPALVGRVFHTFHERAGRVMAAEWKLPAEIISIAGAHHAIDGNTEHPREAALARLAHELDLRMSLRDESGYRAMTRSPSLEALGIRDESARWELIERARKSWEEHAAHGADAAD